MTTAYTLRSGHPEPSYSKSPQLVEHDDAQHHTSGLDTSFNREAVYSHSLNRAHKGSPQAREDDIMHFTLASLGILVYMNSIRASVPPGGQCLSFYPFEAKTADLRSGGGYGYTGDTNCDDGSVCTPVISPCQSWLRDYV
jgi:hypothetical protein